jgi:hypothetical protein
MGRDRLWPSLRQCFGHKWADINCRSKLHSQGKISWVYYLWYKPTIINAERERAVACVPVITTFNTVVLCKDSIIIQGHTAEITYVAMTVTNENHMTEGIKSRLNMRNYCCFLVHNDLFSHLLLKTMKIERYKNILWSHIECLHHIM